MSKYTEHYVQCYMMLHLDACLYKCRHTCRWSIIATCFTSMSLILDQSVGHKWICLDNFHSLDFLMWPSMHAVISLFHCCFWVIWVFRCLLLRFCAKTQTCSSHKVSGYHSAHLHWERPRESNVDWCWSFYYCDSLWKSLTAKNAAIHRPSDRGCLEAKSSTMCKGVHGLNSDKEEQRQRQCGLQHMNPTSATTKQSLGRRCCVLAPLPPSLWKTTFFTEDNWSKIVTIHVIKV